MGILKSIAEFLLGKDADIFDDNGRVFHQLPKKKWDLWKSKYIKSNEYNWRNHSGMKADTKPNDEKFFPKIRNSPNNQTPKV